MRSHVQKLIADIEGENQTFPLLFVLYGQSQQNETYNSLHKLDRTASAASSPKSREDTRYMGTRDHVQKMIANVEGKSQQYVNVPINRCIESMFVPRLSCAST